MSFHSFTVAMGWVAVVLGVFVSYGQFRRMTKRGNEGVSLATWTLFLYLDIFWILYGVDVHSWQLILACVASLPFQVLIWLQLGPFDRLGVCVRSLGILLAFCILPALEWGWAGAVVGAGIAGWASRTPQLVHLIRYDAAMGVSARAWMTAGLVSWLWVVYYLGAHLWPVLFVTAAGGLLSLIIATLAQWRHRQARGIAT
ncbi:MAG TPA: hypothetical protein VII60_03305 [Acidimicrobiales bacterium]